MICARCMQWVLEHPEEQQRPHPARALDAVTVVDGWALCASHAEEAITGEEQE